METKKASKKTREKTVATRKVHKTKGKKSATTSNQSIKDSDTNSSSRSPTSSLPQDVIEVGGEGNSDKRRGWWSR